jgi:myo-inositol-1(or 4)-monophosphatase
MLNFAIETVQQAGHILMEKFGRITVTKKGDINLVTEADLASENHIIERIRSYYPKHAILAEESGEAVIKGGDPSWKWIIDPLDGTTNYAHGYPCFCVTIALEHDGEIVLGVTFDPTRDELFAAERGRGATLNGKPIRVSPTEKLGDSLIVTGFPYDFKQKPNFARHLTDFLFPFARRATRRIGGDRYGVCRMRTLRWILGRRFEPVGCCGRNAFDRRSRRVVTYYDGSKYSIYQPPICASNGAIHSQMLDVLK